MKQSLKIILLIVIPIVYLLFMNLFATVISSGINFNEIVGNESSYIIGGEAEKLGVAEHVTIQVTRHRWYGTIIEDVGDKEVTSRLRLFNIANLPMRSGSWNFVLIHVIILFLWIGIMFIKTDEQRYQYAQHNNYKEVQYR